MKALTICLMLQCSFLLSTQAQTKQDDIKTLIEVSGIPLNTNLLIEETISILKTRYSDVSDNLWTQIRRDISIDDYINRLVLIYDSHFSHQEIRDLIRIHNLEGLNEELTNDSGANQDIYLASKEFGKAIGTKINDRLKQQSSR